MTSERRSPRLPSFSLAFALLLLLLFLFSLKKLGSITWAGNLLLQTSWPPHAACDTETCGAS